MSYDKAMYEVALRICRRSDELRDTILREHLGIDRHRVSPEGSEAAHIQGLVMALLEYLAEQKRDAAAFHERGG